MKIRIVFSLIAIGLAVVSCSKDEDIDVSNDTIEIVEQLTVTQEILELVNEHRQSIGMSVLSRSSDADELAIEHTNYMIAQQKISHNNFSKRFESLQQSVRAVGAGENVAYGYATAESVMNGWLNSPGHRANIEGDFTHIGIAAIKNSQGVYYYAQLFYR